jgi:stage V sporulation protein G
MEITEVRVKLIPNCGDRLKAFCSITFDGEFVVRDLKIIEGTNGAFVAMPSRKLADRCPKCGAKNHLRARFCNECGAKLNEHRASRDRQGRTKLHADVAHPINAGCRERIQAAVIEAYQNEVEASKRPDYQPADYDDDYEEPLEALDDAVDVIEAPSKVAPEPEVKAPSRADREPVIEEEVYEASDYDSLIRELRQEAAQRNKTRKSGFTSSEPVPRYSGYDADSDLESDREVESPVDKPVVEEPVAAAPAPRPPRPAAPKRPVERREPAPRPVRVPEPASVNPEPKPVEDDFGAGIL